MMVKMYETAKEAKTKARLRVCLPLAKPKKSMLTRIEHKRREKKVKRMIKMSFLTLILEGLRLISSPDGNHPSTRIPPKAGDTAGGQSLNRT